MNIFVTAILSFSVLWTSKAHASEFHRVQDPSGALMCFDDHGTKAPLARCAAAAMTYQLVRDPSGSPMCLDELAKLAELNRCETSLMSNLQPSQLDKLPDTQAATVAQTFVAAVESGDIGQFISLIHPRGIHRGHQRLHAKQIAMAVKTSNLKNYVGMQANIKWNLDVNKRWFSIFRGQVTGNPSVAYFERYRGQWRLVQISPMPLTKTVSL